MTKEEKLTEEFNKLKEAVKEFVKAAPEFEQEKQLVRAVGVAMANVETTLHWQFDCWELGLPEDFMGRF